MTDTDTDTVVEIEIPIDQIDDTDRLRPVDPDRAAALAVMFEDTGQQSAIEVRPAPLGHSGKVGAVYKLTFGAHRTAAARILGWATIRAVVRERDEREARLAEIDENLGQRGLSALDRAVFLATRKRIWEELYPETRQGAAPKGKNKVANLATFSQRFSAEAAEKAGLSERAVQRACQLADTLGPELIEQLRHTELADNQSQLLALAKLQAPFRVAVVKRLAEEPEASLPAVLAELGVRPKADPEEALFQALVGAWARANAKVKRRFRAHIGSGSEG